MPWSVPRSASRSGGTPELYFTDPDGILIQLQDVSYWGGLAISAKSAEYGEPPTVTRAIGVTLAVLTAVSTGVLLRAQPAAEGAHAVMPWAYTLNAPPSVGVALDPDGVVRVPGSTVTFRRRELQDLFNPPDWHPDNHPTMPSIVSNGRAPDVRACGFCHLPNGQGRPENAALAGQPAEYIVQQMRDYRNGLRRSAEPEMGPPRAMLAIGLAATEEETRAAAEYFSSFGFRPWIRVLDDRHGAGDPYRGLDERPRGGRWDGAHRDPHHRDA